tara:strand:- start:549 stop:5072 length:4524 start_codon:yes stop_codon:yes gene_type:complete
MGCRYYLDGKVSELYTDFYGYLDNVDPQKRSVDKVYKILKKHGIATKHQGQIYLNQSNLPYGLREIARIAGKYPGLLSTEFIKQTPESYYSRASELHTLTINENVLKNNIPANFEAEADFTYKTQYDIDNYVNTVAGPTDRADVRASEQLRRENTSEQRKYVSSLTDRNRYLYELDPANAGDVIAKKKARILQDMFAKHGITVNVITDTTISGLGQVDPTAMGENPTIRVNPLIAAEDTIPHEFAHIYIDLLGLENPAVQEALAEIKRGNRYTSLIPEIKRKYPDYKGEMFDKELLATAMGLEYVRLDNLSKEKVKNIKKEGWFQKIIQAFKDFWNGFTGNIPALNVKIEALTKDLFTGNLRAEEFVGRFNPALQESRSQEKIKKLVDEQRVRVQGQLNLAKNLPLEQREKLLPQLERLKASLKTINKVEDFSSFVNAMGNSLSLAKRQYDIIMSQPINKRATSENLNTIWKLKGELDGANAIKTIKTLMRAKKLEAKQEMPDRFNTMEERIDAILDEFEVLDNQFIDRVIPILAEHYLQFHNKNIDADLEKIIQNYESNKEKGIYRYAGIKPSPEYQKLKADRKAGKLTDQEFKIARTDLAIEGFKNRMLQDRGSLIREMRRAYKDKSYYSYIFDPIIYTSEPIIQLFVKSISEANIKANDATLYFKGDLQAEYNDFIKGYGEFNVDKLNKDLLEEVTISVYDHKIGENKRVKVLSLIQPLLVDKYYQNEHDAYINLGKKYNKPQRDTYNSYEDFNTARNKWFNSVSGKNYSKQLAKWLSENTEAIPGWEQERDAIYKRIKVAEKIIKENENDAAIVAEYTNQITELRKKLSMNMFNGKPRGEWVQPKKSKYVNPKYSKIQTDPRLKKYYDFVLKEFQEGQSMVGVNRMSKNKWDKFSYLMPSIRKEFLDRGIEQGMLKAGKDLLKEGLTLQETDDDFGIYNDLSGELVKQVPVYYTNVVPSKDISKDIASSLYRFRHMAHKFKAKSEIVGEVMLFRNMMQNRDVLEVSSSGMEQINKVAAQLGTKLPVLKKGESYTFKHLNEWIDTVMFGQEEIKQTFNIFGRELEATKVAGAINKFVALNNLSFNLLQSANQYVMDNISLLQEGIAGQFVNTKQLAWARAKYWGEGAGMQDLGEFSPKTKLGKAMEFFDALVEITDREGNRLVGSKARKFMDSGNLMVLQQAVEHQLSATRMLGLMKSLEGKLKDKNGNVIKRNGKNANLYDLLLIDDKGRMYLDPELSENSFSRSDFIHLLRGLGRRTNQIKGKFDSPILHRTWYGKMIGLFRSWIAPGIRRRYGHGGFTGSTIHTDEELGATTQGFYVTFANSLIETWQNNKGLGKINPFNIYDTYTHMTEMERQNMKRAVVELGAIASTAAIIFALAGMEDDEETWVSNFILYQATRYQTELLQWTPVFGTKEAFRIMKSPTATTRPIEQGLDLMDQIFFQELPYMFGFGDEKDIFYQRRTGRYEKGDRKLRKQIGDLIPVIRGLEKSKTPEEAAKWFNTL